MTAGTANGAPQRLPALVEGMRPRQWAKNVLVLAVPLAAGELLERDVLVATLVAFVCFCLVSSATYLVNDVVDAEADRAHPVKHARPVARGALAPRTALAAAVLLGLVSLGLAWWLTAPAFVAVLLAYLACSFAYSTRLKREPVIELALLAAGFLLRAVAGGAATGIPISQWFLIVAGFGSLFMAAGKRYSELVSLPEGVPPARVSLQGYTLEYLRFVWGVAAGVTITAYCLWAFEVAGGTGWAVWSVAPFVLAVLRYAVDIDAGRAEAPEDVALRDRTLQVLALVWVVLFALGAVHA
ncbi:MAG: decaprenyl-phosphate phosphoribosyltransferase [Candidatus Nanopelagicales bacterium]